MDTANEELSKRLHEILESIGAYEFIRKKYRESAMIGEITLTFESQCYDKASNEGSYYQVGSTCEGTTTLGLHSDIDMIRCYEDCPIVDKLADAKQHGTSFLILIDDDTKPGYVCLQPVIDKIPHTVEMCDVSKCSELKIDWKGRICFTNLIAADGLYHTTNGPANTFWFETSLQTLDLVFALRCRQIPRSANSWLHRKRKNDWPSQKQLKAMGSFGCFLVGVGHPQSDNKSVEWCISFSLQERDLMLNLNETQHKCYILLKMIKKDIIESKVGESISSYHCKTSLFYTIETSHRDWWTESNLIICVRLCLLRLLIWVKAKNCPNYFIPEENMFDKLHQSTLKNVEYVLNDIIDSGLTFLYSLICDNVGELLKSKRSISRLVRSLGNTCPIFFHVFYNNARCVYIARNFLLKHIQMSSNPYTNYMNEMMQLLMYLHSTNHVTEHTTRDVRMAFDSIMPHIKLQYQQCMFAKYLSLRSSIILNEISETSDCDLISSKLSLASLYIQSGQFKEKCEHILVSCENSLEPHVISVCPCYGHGNNVNPSLNVRLVITEMSSQEFRRKCTTGCMVFHPSQVGLVHKALQYEMFRTVYTQPKSDYLLYWITIDSKIYLYFLQYLIYFETGKRAEKDKAVQKLKHVLLTDIYPGHRETGFNLLGWICLQENELQDAWNSFCESWKIKPFNNAAKWHMAALLSELINLK